MKPSVFGRILVAPLFLAMGCAQEPPTRAPPPRTSPSAPTRGPRANRPRTPEAREAAPISDEDFAREAERAIDASNYKRALVDLEKTLRQGE